jgi:hypothetical protein
MNYSAKEDLEFGLEKENETLDLIRTIFDKSLKKVKDKYFCFDFSCENCYVELKSRRSMHDKYTSTMIGKNKLDYASHTKRPVYFVFAFDDGAYYWKYNEEDMKNGNVEIRKGGRTDRDKNEIKDYGYIKTEILIKI